MPNESQKHENTVYATMKYLESEGWRTLKMTNTIPDAIAIKDNQIIAIEAMQKFKKKQRKPGKGKYKGWAYRHNTSIAKTLARFEHFDDVLLVTFYHEYEGFDIPEATAQWGHDVEGTHST